jgi:hypothetical protein
MIYLFVRAFYDLNGSFQGIDDTFFAPLLKERALAGHISLSELCYRLLGVRSDNIYSAAERFRIRNAAIDPQSSELEGFNNQSGLAHVLKSHDLAPSFTRAEIPQHPDADVIITVANFIEHTDLLVLSREDRRFTLREIFLRLKVAKGSAFSAICQQLMPLVKRMLDSAEVDDSAESSFVFAGKLVLPSNPVSSTDELSLEVCKQIGCRSQQMQARHFSAVVRNMLSYQYETNGGSAAYLQMMDLANIYQMPVAGLIQFVGFKFINQFDIYSDVGRFVYRLPDLSYALADPATSTEFDVLTSEQFRKEYSKLEGGGVVNPCNY